MDPNMHSIRPTQTSRLFTGRLLTSGSSTYQVQKYLGQGSFGTVAKCLRVNDGETVAIKIMKSKHSWKVKGEVAILRKLKSLDPERSNLVHWYQIFTDRGHICLEFEHLDKSLFDFMRERKFQPLPLKDIRPIVQQLANALNHLKAARIIHADLKLENVMLVNQQLEPYRVKVIDFGLATSVRFAKVGAYIQTRPFRSPEVILGLPLTEAIDMWSLGCMVAFLYLGTELYNGNNEYEMIKNIMKTQGQLPHSMLCCGRKTHFYFQRDKTSANAVWKLKSPEHVKRAKRMKALENRRLELSSLDDLHYKHIISSDNETDRDAERKDAQMFVDMMKETLQLDTDKRITPSQLMQHHFTRMLHIIDMYPRSKYVRCCSSMMNICQNSKGQVRSTQRPPCRTGNPDQHHCSNPRACTGSETTHRSHKCVTSKAVDTRKAKNTDNVVKAHSGMTATEARSHPGMTDSADWSQPSMPDAASWSHLDVAHRPKEHQARGAHLVKERIAEYYDAKHVTEGNKSSGDNNSSRRSHGSSSGPSTSSYSRTIQRSVPPWVKRKTSHSEDHDFGYNAKSDHDRRRTRIYQGDRSSCHSSHNSIHNDADQSDHRNERHMRSTMKHHWYNRKRFYRSTAGSQTSGSSHKHSCSHTDDYFQPSQRRPDKHHEHHHSFPHPSSCDMTEWQSLSRQKRKSPPDDRDERPTKRNCELWSDCGKCCHRTCASPSTSGCGNRQEFIQPDNDQLVPRRSDKHHHHHHHHHHHCPDPSYSSLTKRQIQTDHNEKTTPQIDVQLTKTPDVHILSPNSEPIKDNALTSKLPTSQE